MVMQPHPPTPQTPPSPAPEWHSFLLIKQKISSFWKPWNSAVGSTLGRDKAQNFWAHSQPFFQDPARSPGPHLGMLSQCRDNRWSWEPFKLETNNEPHRNETRATGSSPSGAGPWPGSATSGFLCVLPLLLHLPPCPAFLKASPSRLPPLHPPLHRASSFSFLPVLFPMTQISSPSPLHTLLWLRNAI